MLLQYNIVITGRCILQSPFFAVAFTQSSANIAIQWYQLLSFLVLDRRHAARVKMFVFVFMTLAKLYLLHHLGVNKAVLFWCCYCLVKELL